MTIRSTAIYFAKEALSLYQMRGTESGKLQRIKTDEGLRFRYVHPDSGYVVILKHAADGALGGAVDATRTREANAAPVEPVEPVEAPAEPVPAVPCATPVKPLAGAARHAVWGGETPREQIRAASFAFHRQAGKTARAAVEAMRADVEAGKVRFPSHHASAAGAVFEAYGESRLKWFGDPESMGLRFVGLAHDAAPAGYAYLRPAVEHSGWYLDPDGHGETVAGVVYQLPGANGRARYLAGYADPWNTDSDGRGPACLSLDVIHGEPLDSSWDSDSALRDAARAGDSIAESMADAERAYQESHRAGRAARELAAEALEACQTWTRAVRGLREVWAARRVFVDAMGPDRARAIVRREIAALRRDCEAFREAREKAREARDSGHGAAWRDGYGEAV